MLSARPIGGNRISDAARGGAAKRGEQTDAFAAALGALAQQPKDGARQAAADPDAEATSETTGPKSRDGLSRTGDAGSAGTPGSATPAAADKHDSAHSKTPTGNLLLGGFAIVLPPLPIDNGAAISAAASADSSPVAGLNGADHHQSRLPAAGIAGETDAGADPSIGGLTVTAAGSANNAPAAEASPKPSAEHMPGRLPPPAASENGLTDAKPAATPDRVSTTPAGRIAALADLPMVQQHMPSGHDGGQAGQQLQQPGAVAPTALPVEATPGSQAALSGAPPAPATLAEHVSVRLVEAVKRGEQEFLLQLYPPELGRVSVRLRISGREVSTWFDTPVAPVQQAIIQTIGQLHSGLASAGYNLSDAWVGGESWSPRERTSGPALRQPRQALAIGQAAPTASPPSLAQASAVSLYV